MFQDTLLTTLPRTHGAGGVGSNYTPEPMTPKSPLAHRGGAYVTLKSEAADEQRAGSV
jgi:hypothetical protein